jgi:BlaI family transcriptional regulator, penicillinase repressor
MAKLPALPPSELEVAKIVWQLGKATVREVSAALPEDRELDFWTVQTYLRRLEAKGYLRKRRVGRNNVYSASVRPSQIVRQLTEDFVTRLFDGETLPLLQHLIQERGLKRDEIEQLQATLDRLKEKCK